jgi:hypothetical protein
MRIIIFCLMGDWFLANNIISKEAIVAVRAVGTVPMIL